jgi:D-galacturonate reductase
VTSAPRVAVIGGGMITHDQLLPSLYQMQREGTVGEISVCALNGRPLRALAASETLRRAFPDRSFQPFPSFESDPDTRHPDLYREVLASLPPRSIAVVAVPDNLHFETILAALEANQHVVTVKPLVLKASDGLRLEEAAFSRGLLVGIDYHKRFDDRSLMGRLRYRQGLFGEFRLGTAALFEKWYYRHSNFQNWCTVERSDAFTYVGCHYVDLVHFITGLLPASVSLCGVRDRYPNGNEGYLWTDARVRWSNGALLNVQNGLSFPDAAPGPNTQGMTLYCASHQAGGLIEHSDQYRGLKYSYVEAPQGAGATQFSEPSPDYLQYVDLGGPGLEPVGYGYRSIKGIVEAALKVERAGGLDERQQALREVDQTGIVATPANSHFNELVIEAGRLSLAHDGREAVIDYSETGRVHLRP